jgi:N-acetyl-anhydromuramyl-L-alanine amidase AmpD
MIKKGDKGTQVAHCQRLLNEKGYKTAVDASFGPSTDTKVREFQRDNGLQDDGIVGQKTWEPLLKLPNFCSDTPKYIIHNGKKHPIKWDRVVLWDEPGGLVSKPGRYYDYSSKSERKPNMFVNHWDVCLSAESCADVLNDRGVSVHFCLDGDGTIYQILDTQHGAWHAGLKKVNQNSIGVEINNAYYLKYQKDSVKRGLGERPLQENGIVHGRTLSKFTWFYDAQIQALKALWAAISEAHGIPMVFPENEDGSLCTTVHNDCKSGSFDGFCNHYNMTERKIDCAGLDLEVLLKEAKPF